MAWFEAFRGQHGFSWYGDYRTAATFDMPLAAITYLAVLIAIATLIATLGIRGRDRWSCSTRAAVGVAIGSIILVCLHGSAWLTGEVAVETQYVYRSGQLVRGSLGLHVGLLTANITLDGSFGGSPVYYSEQVVWPNFGSETVTLGVFLERGLPMPILKVAEYLSVDDGGLRWPRFFHLAGHFSRALLWTGFAFWLITNILLFSVVCYGAYVCALSGVCLVLSSVVYHVCQPPVPLSIPVEEGVLSLRYGWCFWLTLVAGVLVLLGGLLLIILDHLTSKTMARFFGVEIDLDDDGNHSLLDVSNRPSLVDLQALKKGSVFSEPRLVKQQDWGCLNRAFSFGEGMQRVKSNPVFLDVPDIAEAEEPEAARRTGQADRASNSGSTSTDHSEGRDNDLNERTVCALPPPSTRPPKVLRVQVGVHEFSRQSSQDSGHEASFMESAPEHAQEQHGDTVINVEGDTDGDVNGDVTSKANGHVKVDVDASADAKSKDDGRNSLSSGEPTLPTVEKRGGQDRENRSHEERL